VDDELELDDELLDDELDELDDELGGVTTSTVPPVISPCTCAIGSRFHSRSRSTSSCISD
jgi:hypothetical protein